MANTPTYLFDWRIRGIPSDIWQRYAENIGQLISKEKLTPIDVRHVMTPNQVNFALSGQAAAAAGAMVADTATKGKLVASEFFDIRGGMKALHVHYKGAIYLLNDAQWKKFTALVVSDFKAKLETAGSISFDQTMEVAEVAAKFG